MCDQNCQKEYIHRIHKVQDYIEQNIGTQLSVEGLSHVAGFSKYHFSRIFHGMLNESLAHYVNRIRMEQSLFLLAHRQDKNMTDICYELGFTDSAVFSRAFRNYYGLSPKEYRFEYSKNCKEPILLSEYNKTTVKERKEKKSPIKVQISTVRMEEKQLVYVRHTGTYETLAKEYANLMQILFTQAMKQHLIIEDKNWLLSIYHDNPEFGVGDQFRTSICLTVPDGKQIKDDGVLGKMKLEGGLYAVGQFQILQSEYHDAWDYMYQEWLSQSGYVPRNSYPFEVYRSDPENSQDSINKVDIYVPIEPILF